MAKGSDNSAIIILIASFFLLLIGGGITAGLYYGNVTCPKFGANGPVTPSSQTPTPSPAPDTTTPPPPDTTTPASVSYTPVGATLSDPGAAPASVSYTPVGATTVVPGTVSQSTLTAATIPTVVNPPPEAATPPPPAISTPNAYITIPSPPPPAPPSVHGFVPIQTVTRSVVLSPNKSTAPTAGDAGLADGVPLGQWNIPNLTASAYLRFDGSNVMKVRNIAYYNLYGYFINSSGNQIATPYSGDTRFSSFEIGNFYP